METIQYIIIVLIFIAAVVYVVKRFIPSKNQQGGCGKGCGCDFDKAKQS
jgi:flagellar biogenesis protein FliO